MMMLVIRVPGEIRGKGRPKFRSVGGHARAYTDAKTLSAETWVKSCAIDQVGIPRWEGPLSVTINISVGMPESKPKKWKAAALAGEIRPTGKPDFDNTSKMLCDALNGIVWKDDSQITDVLFSKVYSEVPGAELIVRKIIQPS